MINEGIIDPAKVTRSAIQNAASIAGLLLTTEATICDVPQQEKKESAHALREWAAWVACQACSKQIYPYTSIQKSGGLTLIRGPSLFYIKNKL